MRKLINIDLYAKVMLTVIAVCLVWISVRDVPIVESFVSRVTSQPTSSTALTDENQEPPTTQSATPALDAFLEDQMERRRASNGADPRRVAAGEFVLLDEHGKTRAELLMLLGQPVMRFYDESGQSRLSIAYSAADGPMIELLGLGTERKPENETADEEFDRLVRGVQQRQRIVLWLSKDSGPQISLADAKGVTRVSMGIDKNNSAEFPAIRLKNESGKGGSFLSESGFNTFDTQGRFRTTLGLMGDNRPYLYMLDMNGKERIGIGLNEDGGPAILLSDEAGKMRTAIGVTDLEVTKTGETRRTAPSNITLFDKAGKALWQAP